MGSFLCCEARRLHFSNTKQKIKNRHSICLHCHSQLKWYDNLPIISWLILKGKCRKCGKKIGFAELLSELGVAFALLIVGLGLQVSGVTIETLLDNQSPIMWLSFAFSLIFVFLLSFLAIYDGIYGQLPTRFLIIAIVCATILFCLNESLNFQINELGQDLGYLALSVLILGGLYSLLYKISHGKWVGDGDWLLGVAIAIALAHPWLALITLFLANFLACLVMLPIVRRHQNHKIYFGPFMVAAFIITYSFSEFFYGIINLW